LHANVKDRNQDWNPIEVNQETLKRGTDDRVSQVHSQRDFGPEL